MVSPHFPPDSSAASHRVRLLAPHLEEAGWSPTVVTLERSAYEGRLDPGLEALVPDSLRVVRAPRVARRRHAACRSRRSWPARLHRPAQHLPRTAGPRAVRRAVHHRLSGVSRAPWRRSEIRVPRPVRPRLSGSRGSARGACRSAADRAVRRTGRAAPRAGLARGSSRRPSTPPTRSWRSRKARSTASSSASLRRRGCRTASFRWDSNPPTSRRCERGREGARRFDPADGFVHLCYVGTAAAHWRRHRCGSCSAALARARRDDPAALRLRLHFFGTSNQSDSNVHRVLPIARECGVSDAVTEMPGRLDYLDALSVLMHASGDSSARQFRTALHREQAIPRAAREAADPGAVSTRRAASSRSCARPVRSRRSAS